MKNSILTLNNIEKKYTEEIKAVSDFSIDIKEGEFIALLGPSGCGKTTTLRMIAGLEDISSGELLLNGERANETIPSDRNLAMVFQDYALIPHKTVYDNIAYPLVIAKKDKAHIKTEVDKIIKMVKLEEYQTKKPAALSGGQRQRVALARALVKECPIILMDEPLSNLDVELRSSARTDIIKMNRDFGKTVIYVTHDQIEAMTMASRIVVMKKGEVQQIGTSKEIYNFPINEFVAKFVGNPGMNVFNIEVTNGNIENCNIRDVNKIDGFYKLGIRPENITLSNTEEEANFSGEIVNMEDFGNDLILEVKNEIGKIKVRIPNVIDINLFDKYHFKFNLATLKYFDEEGVVIND